MFDFSHVHDNFHLLLSGLWVTLAVTSISLLLAAALGLFLALCQLEFGITARRLSSGYISLFRTVPEFILILWVYFCFPLLLGLPINRNVCGILALTFVGAAYMAEIFRAGAQAIPRSQRDAAYSLGFSGYARWRFIILPQALRTMMPAFVNYFTELFKTTTLLAAIGVAELAYRAQEIGASTYQFIEPFTVAALFFILINSFLSVMVRKMDAKLAADRGY